MTRICEHGNLRRGCPACWVAGTREASITITMTPLPGGEPGGGGRLLALSLAALRDQAPPQPEQPAPTRVPGPGLAAGQAERWPRWLPGLLVAVALAVLLQAGATRLLCP